MGKCTAVLRGNAFWLPFSLHKLFTFYKNQPGIPSHPCRGNVWEHLFERETWHREGVGWTPCYLLSYWWTSSARLQMFHKPSETNLLSWVADGLLSWILNNYQRDLGQVLCIRFSLNKTHLDIKYFSGEILYAGLMWKHVQAKWPKHPGPKLETNSAHD